TTQHPTNPANAVRNEHSAGRTPGETPARPSVCATIQPCFPTPRPTATPCRKRRPRVGDDDPVSDAASRSCVSHLVPPGQTDPRAAIRSHRPIPRPAAFPPRLRSRSRRRPPDPLRDPAVPATRRRHGRESCAARTMPLPCRVPDGVAHGSTRRRAFAPTPAICPDVAVTTRPERGRRGPPHYPPPPPRPTRSRSVPRPTTRPY